MLLVFFFTYTGVTNERYINLNGKQVEIKKAEPRDGGGYNKMGDSSQWGHHQGQPMGMVQGPNGQMGGPPMNMHAPNMMPGTLLALKTLSLIEKYLKTSSSVNKSIITFIRLT